MPTHNRRRFVPQAITYFLRQDYVERELIIIDDGPESVGDLVPDDARIRYIRREKRLLLGAKRNLACEAAEGELIVHWDDDDWLADWRLSYQVENLIETQADICGLDRLYFYNPERDQAWQYVYPTGARSWLAGGTLCYTKNFWRHNPFPQLNVGEDTRFVWSKRSKKLIALADNSFYIALIHAENTSPKRTRGARWQAYRAKDIHALMGPDLAVYRAPSKPEELGPPAPLRPLPAGAGTTRPLQSDPERLDMKQQPERQPFTYAIIMVVHNACEMVKLSTLRTLRHSATHHARLIVVDNASSDGVQTWLDLLAQRGDIDLIRSQTNIGHGPGLELAWRRTQSPYIVTLDSDAFPLTDEWLPRLRAKLSDRVKVAGIRHHRDYIHPSCLMIARQTLADFDLTFLNEKDQPSRLDVAERISHEIKRRGYQLAGLARTGAQRRGSVAEPVYLGSAYEDLVYHQWYTTRARITPGDKVDDVPPVALERSLQELFEAYQSEPREVTVVMGLQASKESPQRVRNALAAVRALNLQDLARWRYRIIVIEQGQKPHLESELVPLVDRYLFAYNPGPYNRGWAFNIGATLSGRAGQVLCLIDADLLVSPGFLREGLAKIQAGARALLPFKEIVYLEAASTEQALRDRFAAPLESITDRAYQGRSFTTSQGGCIWVEADLYHQLGGHDERFRGWGSEDREFWERLSQATTIERLPQRLLHLDHPPAATADRWAIANRRLYQQLSSTSSSRATSTIGNLHLYTTAAPLAERQDNQPGKESRDWENWHLWTSKRIEKIIRDEQFPKAGVSSRRKLAEIIVQLGDQVLDIGCGPGALWPHFAPYRPRVSWAGIDITTNMLVTARRFFSEVPTSQADAGRLPFADNGFGIVVLRHMLEHLPQWLMEQTLTEAIRVARQAVVIDFHTPPAGQGRHQTVRVGENFLETRWTAAQIEGPIAKAGWRVHQRLDIIAARYERDQVWLVADPQTKLPARLDDTSLDVTSSGEPARISIIMPTYRRSHTIHQTIATIQAQTYQNWELIIIDNAGDGSYQFDDPRIQLFRHSAKASASYARNQGLRYATGDLVCFFDDDDEMFPHYLERFARAFRDNPKTKMVRCGMIVSNGQVNYSYATPECCLRREFATPTWPSQGPAQDQKYFRRLVSDYGWSERKKEIVIIREALCRAKTSPRGGLRSGDY